MKAKERNNCAGYFRRSKVAKKVLKIPSVDIVGAGTFRFPSNFSSGGFLAAKANFRESGDSDHDSAVNSPDVSQFIFREFCSKSLSYQLAGRSSKGRIFLNSPQSGDDLYASMLSAGTYKTQVRSKIPDIQ